MLARLASMPDDSERQWVKSLGLFSVIVTFMIGYPAAGAALGYAAWKWMGLPRWVVAPPVVLGFVLAMIRLVRLARPTEENDSDAG